MSVCKNFSYEEFKGNLSPVRAISITNIDGEYYNGPAGDGVDATLRLDADSLTIDGVVLNVNDRVLLAGQTAAYQNGIYFISCIDYDNFDLFLQRAQDQQSRPQFRTGQFIVATAGISYRGNIFSLVEPLPSYIGVDPINWIPVSNTDLSPVILKNLGTWNATTNMTSDGKQLASSVGEEGGFYVVSVAGNTNLNGITDWEVQQIALFLGGSWLKYDLTKIYNFLAPLKLEGGNVSLVTTPSFTVTNDALDIPFGSALKLYTNLPISSTVTLPYAVDLGLYGTSTFNATNFKTMGRPAFLAINNGNLAPDQQLPEAGRYACVMLPYQPGSTPYISMLMVNTENGSMHVKWTNGDATWGTNRSLQFYNTNQTGLLSNLQTSVKTTLVDAINSLNTAYNAPLVLTTGSTRSVSLATDNTLAVANNKLQIPLSNSLKIYVDSPQPGGNKTCLDLNYYADGQWVADNFKLLERPCFLGVYNEFLPTDQRLPENGKYGAVMLPYQVGSVHQIAMILVHTDTANMYIKWTHGNATWGVNQYVQIYNTNQTGLLSSLTTTAKNTLVAATNEVKANVGNLASLTTTVKTDTVSAINEVKANQGNLASLTTTDKTSLVGAINSLVTAVNGLEERVPDSYVAPINLNSGALSLSTNNSLGLTSPDQDLKVAVTYSAPISINESTQVVSLATDGSLTVIDDKLSVVNSASVQYIPPLFIDNDENVFLQTNKSLHVTDNNELEVPLSKGLRIYTDLPQPGGPNKECLDLDYYSDAAWVADNFKNFKRPGFLSVYNDFMADDQKLPETGKYGCVMLPYQTSGDNHIAMLLAHTESANLYAKWTAGNDNWGVNQYVQFYNTNQTGKLADIKPTASNSTIVAAINSLGTFASQDHVVDLQFPTSTASAISGSAIGSFTYPAGAINQAGKGIVLRANGRFQISNNACSVNVVINSTNLTGYNIPGNLIIGNTPFDLEIVHTCINPGSSGTLNTFFKLSVYGQGSNLLFVSGESDNSFNMTTSGKLDFTVRFNSASINNFFTFKNFRAEYF